MKIGKTKDGRVWMMVEVKINEKPAEIMLTWTPKDALMIADSLKKAAGYAEEEHRIIVPRAGIM